MNIVCISHLRWDFVLQRPQHLLNRAAREGACSMSKSRCGVTGHRTSTYRAQQRAFGGRPHLPDYLRGGLDIQRELLDQAVRTYIGEEFILSSYTPMGVPFSNHLGARRLSTTV